MPGAWPPGRTRPSNSLGSMSDHAIGSRNSGVASSSRVERLGLVRGTELAEDHAGEQPRVGRGRRAGSLGRETTS